MMSVYEQSESAAPEVKPEVVFVWEIVKGIRDGEFRIPRFQRRYVWRRDQMIDLLDSVRKQYPIGSILVWDTKISLDSMERVGPIRVSRQEAGTTTYILDGHQRLSTLAGSLLLSTNDEPDSDDEDMSRWQIWFNIDEERFEHLKSETNPGPEYFPLWKLMDTFTFLEECKKVMEKLKGDWEKANLYIHRLQTLSQVFQAYKLPVIRIRNTSLNQAVEIFARLNAKGQPMSPDQMVTALTYREIPGEKPPFNLAEEIDEILRALSGYGFGNIERTVVLRALLASSGQDIYRTDWTRIASTQRQARQVDLSSAVSQTLEAVTRSAEFLNSIGVHNNRLLPYAMQMVVLGAFFLKCPKPTASQRALLERWFWVSSFTGWFASANPSRVSALVAEFRDNIATNTDPKILTNMPLEEPAQPFPSTFDMRSARTRTLLLELLSFGPCDESGEKIPEPWRLISEYGPDALGNIVASWSSENHQLGLSPVNRMLRINIREKDRSQAKNWLLRININAQKEILESHGIPQDAFEKLRQGDNDDFLMKRQAYLIEQEKIFMEERGVTPPINSQPRPAPIDTAYE